jgi:hypothetical protein
MNATILYNKLNKEICFICGKEYGRAKGSLNMSHHSCPYCDCGVCLRESKLCYLYIGKNDCIVVFYKNPGESYYCDLIFFEDLLYGEFARKTFFLNFDLKLLYKIIMDKEKYKMLL